MSGWYSQAKRLISGLDVWVVGVKPNTKPILTDYLPLFPLLQFELSYVFGNKILLPDNGRYFLIPSLFPVSSLQSSSSPDLWTAFLGPLLSNQGNEFRVTARSLQSYPIQVNTAEVISLNGHSFLFQAPAVPTKGKVPPTF